jgi:hypothetical protein
LPLPEPAPRPTRLRFFVAPGLSESSFNFIVTNP